jgi:hypothetical protein
MRGGGIGLIPPSHGPDEVNQFTQKRDSDSPIKMHRVSHSAHNPAFPGPGVLIADAQILMSTCFPIDTLRLELSDMLTFAMTKDETMESRATLDINR